MSGKDKTCLFSGILAGLAILTIIIRSVTKSAP